jgi:hypothetical protein
MLDPPSLSMTSCTDPQFKGTPETGLSTKQERTSVSGFHISTLICLEIRKDIPIRINQ